MTDSPASSPASRSTMRYRIEEYESLLRSFQDAGYSFSTFSTTDRPNSQEIFIRHDVDLSISRALAMAELERQLGVQSTYCFLLTAPVYDLKLPQNVRALDRIDKLGHEVALHFDSHRYWHTDASPEPAAEAIDAKVCEELDVLGRLVETPVSTASFHIPPEWVLGRPFDGFTNTYSPPYFSDIGYVSDSSQKWLTAEPFPDGLDETFQLLVHPGLWHAEHEPMAEIVDERRKEAYDRVDRYLDPLG